MAERIQMETIAILKSHSRNEKMGIFQFTNILGYDTKKWNLFSH